MKVRESDHEKETSEVEILLEFLQRTKNGTYATIERTSLPFSRTKASTLEGQEESFEHYYYGLS